MVQSGQVVQKIWQKWISRSSVTSSFPWAASCCGWLRKTNCIDHFGAKMVEIGQAVQKIWQEELCRSRVTSSCPRPSSCSCSLFRQEELHRTFSRKNSQNRSSGSKDMAKRRNGKETSREGPRTGRRESVTIRNQ